MCAANFEFSKRRRDGAIDPALELRTATFEEPQRYDSLPEVITLTNLCPPESGGLLAYTPRTDYDIGINVIIMATMVG